MMWTFVYDVGLDDEQKEGEAKDDMIDRCATYAAWNGYNAEDALCPQLKYVIAGDRYESPKEVARVQNKFEARFAYELNLRKEKDND